MMSLASDNQNFAHTVSAYFRPWGPRPNAILDIQPEFTGLLRRSPGSLARHRGRPRRSVTCPRFACQTARPEKTSTWRKADARGDRGVEPDGGPEPLNRRSPEAEPAKGENMDILAERLMVSSARHARLGLRVDAL